MELWKLAASYFVPALFFVTLLCGHFFSHFELLEKWFLRDNEVRQIVSLPPATNLSHDNRAEVGDEAGKWSNNGYANGHNHAFSTAEAYFNQALVNEKAGQFEEAMHAYQQALIQKRNFPQALLNIGALYYRRKEWQNARDAFVQALRIDNYYAKAYFNLSLVYRQLGELDKAAQAARQATALNSKNSTAYN